MTKIYEPEDYLETLNNMIAITEEFLVQDTLDEDERDDVVEDLARLRDLHHRIRLQFGLEEATWH